MPPTIYRLAEVKRRTGLATSTIYYRMGRGTFPRPIPLGEGSAVGWISEEIDNFILDAIRKARPEEQAHDGAAA